MVEQLELNTQCSTELPEKFRALNRNDEKLRMNAMLHTGAALQQ